MSKGQSFAVFCALKFDVRNCNLSYDEASELIQLANSDKAAALEKVFHLPGAIQKGEVSTVAKTDNEAIFQAADKAGKAAADACIPIPMMVCQHKNVMDDNSPILKEWYVPSGVCGFASVVIEDGRSGFAKYLKAKHGAGKHYYGGMEYWCGGYGQSMERKEAYCHAFCRVVSDAGIKCRTWSRMD